MTAVATTAPEERVSRTGREHRGGDDSACRAAFLAHLAAADEWVSSACRVFFEAKKAEVALARERASGRTPDGTATSAGARGADPGTMPP